MQTILLMELTRFLFQRLYLALDLSWSARVMGKRTDEPYINEELNDRIGWIVDDVLLHDETFKEWEHDIDKQERMHLSELGRMCQNFTKTDFAAVCITAMENYPFMVMQIVAEYLVNQRKGKD